MEDYKARGKNVDAEYAKILSEKKKQVSKSVIPITAYEKKNPTPPLEIPLDIVGKTVKHKIFGIGTITTIIGTSIEVNFEQAGIKKMGYELCVKNHILEFI